MQVFVFAYYSLAKHMTLSLESIISVFNVKPLWYYETRRLFAPTPQKNLALGSAFGQFFVPSYPTSSHCGHEKGAKNFLASGSPTWTQIISKVAKSRRVSLYTPSGDEHRFVFFNS